MDTTSTISILSPFSSAALTLDCPAEPNGKLITTAAIMENVGALWMLSAENLGDLDIAAMETKLDLIALSLTKHITKTSVHTDLDLSELKSFFAKWEFEQSEYSQVMHSANLQVKHLPPFLRDFFLSGIRQVICENHTSLIDMNEDFREAFARLVELSMLHQQYSDRFDRLGEMAFLISGIFSTIRLETLKKRLFPFSENVNKLVSHQI